MNSRELLNFLLLCVLGLFPIASLGQMRAPEARVVDQIDESNRVILKGNTHPLALFAKDAGMAPDTLPMESILLILRRGPEKQAALDQLLREQQERSSANFHKWLTPEEFGLRFGPSDEEICGVTAWLARLGFKVKNITPGRTFLEFSGTAGQVRNAFHTEIRRYNFKGVDYWANDRDPEIPSALAPVVGGFVSLNEFWKAVPSTTIQSSKMLSSNAGATPRGIASAVARNQLATVPGSGQTAIPVRKTILSGAGCTPTLDCYAVGPGDFATIYDVNPVYAAKIDGTGETIAIASSSNINPNDVTNFRSLFNLPIAPILPNLPNGNPPYANILLQTPDPGLVPGREGPATLQVQWAGAIAPGATIDLVVSQSTPWVEGANLSAITAINDNLAPVLTLSFQACEPAVGLDSSGHTFYYYLWEQAAAEGITVVAPTGDSGPAACDSHFQEVAASLGVAVNAVASTVYNVAVGGTDFDQVGNWTQYWNSSNDANLASAKSYIPEVAWNDTCAENGPSGCSSPNPTGSDLVAGGGGVSLQNGLPTWQRILPGVDVNGGRLVPDISLFASDGNNGSFYPVCQGDANEDGNTTCDLKPPFLHIQAGGGTAVAAAAFSGVMALVDQKMALVNKKDSPQGNANFVLYALAQNSSNGVFHDVTKGNTSVACYGGPPTLTTPAFPQDCSASQGYGIVENAGVPLWLAGTGYDLATGLGSIDVNNLLTNWPNVSFDSTKTTIISVNAPDSPNTVATVTNSKHGQVVSFRISVTSDSGTPTGDVTLLVKPNPPPAPQFAPFEADVLTPLVGGSIVGGMPTTPTPPPPPAPPPPPVCQKNFITSCTIKLPGGAYQLIAHYAGDGTFAPSDSDPVNITVTPQASQTTLSVEDNSHPGESFCYGSGDGPDGTGEQLGSPFFLLVTIDNPQDQRLNGNSCYPQVRSNAPTGTVTINDLTTNFKQGYALNARGVLEIPSFPSSLGTHQITATYSGDASYLPSRDGFTSDSPPDPELFFTVTIEQGSSRLILSANPTLILAGTTVTLTAEVTSQVRGSLLPAPTGTVTFLLADGTVIGHTGLSPNPRTAGDNIATLDHVFDQTSSVTATYSGDANYSKTASFAPVTITVGIQDFSISSVPAFLPLTAGTPGSAFITVTPILGFTGTVALTCPAPALLLPGMTCSFAPPTVTISAGGNPVTSTLTLNTEGPSVILADAKPYRPQWMVAGVTSMALGAIFLFGFWRRNQFVVFCCVVLAAALCGSCVGGGSPGSSAVESSIALGTSSVKSPFGSDLTLRASVSADHTVSGTVDFYDNGVKIAPGVPVQTGRASFKTTTLGVGTHPITASYSGDASTLPASANAPLEQVITGSSQMRIVASSGKLNHNLELQFSIQ